jgi:Resolvase, N terminal domain
MLIGYARVSTDGQDHALQLDALRAAGCDKVFVETASGTRTDRPELAKALDQARKGDVLVVWRLDRLARSLRHLIDIADDLNRRGVALKSITENIDTTTPSGRFMFNILGALSSMEREIIVERTRAGLVAAAARGRRGGRPAALDQARSGRRRRCWHPAPCLRARWHSSLDAPPAPFTGTSQVVDQGSSRRLLNPYQNPHWRSHSRLCHENTYKEVISSHTDDSCRC